MDRGTKEGRGTQGQTQEQLGGQGGHWKVSWQLDLSVPGKEVSFQPAFGEAVCQAPTEGYLPGWGVVSPPVVVGRVAQKAFGLGRGHLVTCHLGSRTRQHLPFKAGLLAAEPGHNRFTQRPSRDCMEQLLWG